MAEQDAHLSLDGLTTDMRRRSTRGGLIAFSAQGIKIGLQFAAVIVLTRLLPPSAFGLVAMVSALNAVFDLVKELGLSAATIQKPDITHGQVSALFWINAAAGALLAATLFLVAPLIAGFYGEPDLVGVTRWLAVGFLFSGLTTQHWALLRRRMRFGQIAALEAGSDTLALTVSVGMALAGMGYWALVAQRLVGPVMMLIGCWSLCRWRPSRPEREAGLGQILGFGAAVTGCNIATALTRSVDQVLIGWLWGPAILGLYERSVRLLLMPINNISVPLYAVAMPALSRISDARYRYRAAFGEILSIITMLTAPVGALVAVTADWLVQVVFGQRWLEAAPLVSLFGIAIAYQPAMATTGLVYLSQNRPRELLRASLLDAGLALILVLAGLPFGVIGIAACVALGGLFLRAPLAFWLASRTGAVTLGDLYAATLPSAAAALLVAAAEALLRRAAWPAGFPAAGNLAIAALVALLLAPAALALYSPSRAILLRLASSPRSLLAAKPVARL